MTSSDEHWESVYRTKGSHAVSWYRPHLETSLALIEAVAPDRDARIVDVGGGASTLVDDLLDRGYRNVTVLDLSQAALDLAAARLGERAALVRWVQGDATTTNLGCEAFDVWHDRAVFHFLTEPADRARYIDRACCSLRLGGHLIVATFAPDGPEKCSGLPVARYSAAELQAAFGDPYALIDQRAEVHETPWGTAQSFTYCLCSRVREC